MPPKSAHISKWIGGRAGFWHILRLNSLEGNHEKTLRSLPRHIVGCSCGRCTFSLKNGSCSGHHQSLQSGTGPEPDWRDLSLIGNRRRFSPAFKQLKQTSGSAPHLLSS